MSETVKKQIRLKEGFWTTPESEDQPRLIASKCESCGEIFFPKKDNNWCIHCYQKTLKEVLLSRDGKIFSFSVVMQQPGGGFYRGEVPYSYGLVDLPDGIRIWSLFDCENFEDLEQGQDVELVINKLHEDNEGNEVVTFKFRPKK